MTAIKEMPLFKYICVWSSIYIIINGQYKQSIITGSFVA